MGGKNAVIVDADADLDEAVKGVVDSAFGYGGQKCSAGSRAIVLDGIYDQFLTRLVEATKSLTVAPADDPGCSRRPGDRRRGPRPHPRRPSRRARRRRSSRTQTDVGPLADAGVLRRPDDLRGRAGERDDRPGGDLRPGAVGDPGEGPGRRPADRQRDEVRPDRRVLQPQPEHTWRR